MASLTGTLIIIGHFYSTAILSLIGQSRRDKILVDNKLRMYSSPFRDEIYLDRLIMNDSFLKLVIKTRYVY
jgi:hypothetical protein